MRKATVIFSAALAAVLLSSCGGRTEVKVNDYFKTNLTGANGGGSISWEVDTAQMIQDNYEAFNLKKDDSLALFSGVAADVNKSINGSFDKSDSLSNGDKVHFTWDTSQMEAFEKAYPNAKLVVEEVDCTVEGLAEVQDFDPFDYITVSFKSNGGNEPEAAVELSPEFPVSADDITIEKDWMTWNDGAGTLRVEFELTSMRRKRIDGKNPVEQYFIDNGYRAVQTWKEYTYPES